MVNFLFEFKSIVTKVRQWDRTYLRTKMDNLRPKFGLSVCIRIEVERFTV